MAKASLTISILGEYQSKALDKARQDLQKLQEQAAISSGGLSGGFVSAGQSMQLFGTQLQKAGEKMQSVGVAATKNITLPIVAASAATIAAAVNIDDALTSVKKTVDGTDAQYQQLKESAIAFSKVNAVSASQMMEIEALGAQLGFAIEELDEFGRVVSGLDIATDMNAEQAATEMAQFANITKMAHNDVSNYGSAIVGLGNNMATTESAISSMAMRVAAAGTQVGMSQADILGLSAALTSMGVSAEAGGTAISTIMSQIDKDIALGSESIQTWASAAKMSAEQFAKAWKTDPVQALSALMSGMDEATQEGSNMAVMLDDLGISSLRQTDVMKRLAGNSELVADAVELANSEWEKNTALTKEVDNRNNSLSSQFEMVKNRAVAVAEQVGRPLAQSLISAIDAAEPLIVAVSNLAEQFSNMDEGSRQVVIGLIGAAAAFGPVVTVAGKFYSVTGKVITVAGKVVTKIGVMTSGYTKLSAEELKAQIAGEKFQASTNKIPASTTKAAAGVGKLSSGITAFNAAAKMTAVGLAIGLIADIASRFSEASERADKLKKATEGLNSAMSASASAYNSFNGSVASSGESLENFIAFTSQAVESQAELADQLTETWSDVGTNSALVDNYAQTIAELGNKGKLTAAEQVKLKDAVEGFNQLTGSSIAIVNDATGQLNTQKDAVLDLAEAYKQEAYYQALRTSYAEANKKLVEQTEALRQAEERLATEEHGLYVEISGVEVASDAQGRAYHQLEQDADALRQEITTLESSMTSYANQLAILDGNFQSVDDALAACGASMADFGDISESQLSALKENFDGTLTSIVEVCNEQGLEIPQALANGINDTASNASDASEKMAKDCIDAVSGMPDDMRVTGTTASSNMASGIGSNTSAVGSSASALYSSAISGIAGTVSSFTTTATQAASGYSGTIGSSSAYSQGQTFAKTAKDGVGSVSAKSAGSNFVSSFGSGMGSVNIWSTAYNVGMSALSAIKSALGIHSPSKEGKYVGNMFVQGVEIGEEKESKYLVDSMYGLGRDSLNAFNSGINSGVASFAPISEPYFDNPIYDELTSGNKQTNITLNVIVNGNKVESDVSPQVNSAVAELVSALELYTDMG